MQEYDNLIQQLWTFIYTDCPGCGIGNAANDLTCTYPCGYLASPNHPALYPDSTSVTWSIQTVENNYIQLEFLTFKVESARPDCEQDYLEIYNILRNGGKGFIGRYCINSPPPAVLLSGMNELTLVFQSDIRYSNSGFYAHYSSKHYILQNNIRKEVKTSSEYILHIRLD